MLMHESTYQVKVSHQDKILELDVLLFIIVQEGGIYNFQWQLVLSTPVINCVSKQKSEL